MIRPQRIAVKDPSLSRVQDELLRFAFSLEDELLPRERIIATTVMQTGEAYAKFGEAIFYTPSADLKIHLPENSAKDIGKYVMLKNITDDASTPVVIVPSLGGTIDGASTLSITDKLGRFVVLRAPNVWSVF
jgi:hypothetical protein